MDDSHMGQITQFAFDFVPYGFLLCDGATLQIAEHIALFDIIGTTYGGDGITTFKLPDLTKATAFPSMKYYISIVGVYPAEG